MTDQKKRPPLPGSNGGRWEGKFVAPKTIATFSGLSNLETLRE